MTDTPNPENLVWVDVESWKGTPVVLIQLTQWDMMPWNLGPRRATILAGAIRCLGADTFLAVLDTLLADDKDPLDIPAVAWGTYGGHPILRFRSEHHGTLAFGRRKAAKLLAALTMAGADRVLEVLTEVGRWRS